MKFSLVFTAALCLLCYAAQAEFSNSNTGWHPGVIVLNDNSLVKGDISYDYKHDLVMSRQHHKTQTFTARQVQSFYYVDTQTNIQHRYTTITYEPQPLVKQTAMFEVVLDGEVSYLRKHNRFPAFENRSPQRDFHSNTHRVCYDYYVYYRHELTKAHKFSRKVLPKLEEKNSSLAEFIKAEKLRMYDIADQIILLQHVNAKGSMSAATTYHSK